jgi:phage terminase small subunit
MPILKNARRERFAQEIVKGTTASEAYVIAGYKRDDGNASKLLANPEIQARIQEITSVALKKAGLTGEQVIAELGRIGLANMMDYMTIGADGA